MGGKNNALVLGDQEELIYLLLEMSTGAGASALNSIERSKINVLKVKSQNSLKKKKL